MHVNMDQNYDLAEPKPDDEAKAEEAPAAAPDDAQAPDPAPKPEPAPEAKQAPAPAPAPGPSAPAPGQQACTDRFRGGGHGVSERSFISITCVLVDNFMLSMA